MTLLSLLIFLLYNELVSDLYSSNFLNSRGGGAGSVPWAGGLRVLLLGFYLTEAFKSQTKTEKILYNKSR